MPGIAFDNRPAFTRKVKTFGQLSSQGNTVEDPAGIERTLFVFGERSVVIALWLPATITFILPAFWAVCYWVRYRRQSRRCRNLCATCSYNLTGNTSGICPECGTTAKSKDVPIKIA